MNRQEFSKPLRRAIIRRAMLAGIPTCEWIDDAGVRCVCTKGLEIAASGEGRPRYRDAPRRGWAHQSEK